MTIKYRRDRLQSKVDTGETPISHRAISSVVTSLYTLIWEIENNLFKSQTIYFRSDVIGCSTERVGGNVVGNAFLAHAEVGDLAVALVVE